MVHNIFNLVVNRTCIVKNSSNSSLLKIFKALIVFFGMLSDEFKENSFHLLFLSLHSPSIIDGL